MSDNTDIEKRAVRIELLLMDCDGVLTDGRIWIQENGDDQKCFHVRDGMGIELLHRGGLISGIISGRTSKAVEERARALGMSVVSQGCADKVKAFDDILRKVGLSSDEVAYVGDDLTDIRLMRRCGLAIAVADAAAEVREQAHYVTASNGGHGAIREVAELILKAQGKWERLMSDML